jgi:uncharacterized protein with HEPN domain
MMKDDLVFAGHMLDMARKARALSAGITRQRFDEDEALRLALTHLLQVIGEAATRISPAYQATHVQIPWRDITGMRHRIVHDYLDVDYDVVWDTLQNNLDPLMPLLERLIDEGSFFGGSEKSV